MCNQGNYIISLGYQAMVFMGEVENPASKLIEKNLPQAKFIIDILVMLREKIERHDDFTILEELADF